MTTTTTIWLICRRCETPFPTPHIRSLCPPCAYRQQPDITSEVSGT